MHAHVNRLVACATAGIVGLTLTQAEAVVVTITDGPDAGLVVFDSGSFENETVGQLPANADAGTYRFTQETAVSVTTGASSITNGPDGAYHADNYLTVDREAGGAIRVAEFSQPITTSIDSFTIEWADWGLGTLTAYSVGEAGADGTAGSTDGLLGAWGVHSGGTGPGNTRFVAFRSADAGGTQTLELPYVFGQWNLMRYTWDASEQAGSLTVNGTTVEIGTHDFATPVTVEQFFFRGNTGGSVVFVDSVPEPGSLGLGAAGFLLLTRRRSGRRS